MKIQSVTDAAFSAYGKILTGYDTKELIEVMKTTPCPEDATIYVASAKELEELEVAKKFQREAYGELPIEIGYCNGNNKTLNALEYHRSSEVNVAVNDLILLLGKQQDIEADHTYDTSKVEAFLVPAGTVVEVYATSLHYAPCTAEGNGFRCVVVLPKGTNTDIEEKHEGGEDKLVAAKNKWLIAHEEAKIEGAFCGLKGENITL